MKNRKWISIRLTKERQWPWFFRGSCLLLLGIWQAVIYLHVVVNPPPGPDSMKLNLALINASSDLEQAQLLSNRVETVTMNYDISPESDTSPLEILLATPGIEDHLKRLSGVGSNSFYADFHAESVRVVALETSVRQLEAKRCRQKLNEITKTVAKLTRERQSTLEELKSKRTTSINKQRWWANGTVASIGGGTILYGLTSLATAYRSRSKNGSKYFQL